MDMKELSLKAALCCVILGGLCLTLMGSVAGPLSCALAAWAWCKFIPDTEEV
jgi:hypothetical protein